MKARESITAVIGALGAALLSQYLLYAAFVVAIPVVAGQTWTKEHIDMLRGLALSLGFIASAIAAGFAVGRLSPTNPILHVLAVGVASPVLGYALAGPIALAVDGRFPCTPLNSA